jgi:hypothetical protein
MSKSSTRLLVILDPGECNEIIDVDDLLELNYDSSDELDAFFNLFDYSPSDEVIDRILKYSSLK